MKTVLNFISHYGIIMAVDIMMKYINNIVDFSAWLQEQDIEPITDDEFYRLEELLELYKKGQ